MNCEICGKTFRSMYYVARHLKQVHKIIVGPLKRGPVSDGKYICHYCGGNWTRKVNLKNHLRLIHNPLISRPSASKTQCPYEFCGLKFRGLSKNLAEDIRKHILNEHTISDVAFVEKQFLNAEDFMDWKENEERIEQVRFIKMRGISKRSTKTVSYFYCNKSIRHPRRQDKNNKIESSKLNKFCPAKITAVKNSVTGEVTAKYFNIHVGHSKDVDEYSRKKRFNDEKIQKQDSTPIITDCGLNKRNEEYCFPKDIKAEVLSDDEIPFEIIIDNHVNIEEISDCKIKIIFEGIEEHKV